MYTVSSIRELVASNQLYQLLSDKLDIRVPDYDKTFEQVCSERNMSPAFIQTLIRTYDDSGQFPYSELQELSISELTDYLRRSHRFYLEKKLPEMEQTALQIAQHFNQSDELLSYLCLFFVEYKKNMVDHIGMEETVLFPYINRLLNAHDLTADIFTLQHILQSFSAKQFLEEHSDIESGLHEVRRVISGYQPKGQMPFPFKVFLNQLHSFEAELNRHAIIEDEILIPKVLELEMQLQLKAGLHLTE